jgi:hypothetical protein
MDLGDGIGATIRIDGEKMKLSSFSSASMSM